MSKEIKVKSNVEKLRELIVPYKLMQYITIVTWYVLFVGFIIFLIVSPDVRNLSRNLNSVSEKVRQEANLFKWILIISSSIFLVASVIVKYCSYYTTTRILNVISNLREELLNDESKQEKVELIDLILKEKRLYQYCTFANVFLFKPLKDISK